MCRARVNCSPLHHYMLGQGPEPAIKPQKAWPVLGRCGRLQQIKLNSPRLTWRGCTSANRNGTSTAANAVITEHSVGKLIFILRSEKNNLLLYFQRTFRTFFRS